MSDAIRNFSKNTFREDISRKDLSLWEQYNYFEARSLNLGRWLSLSLCPERSNTLAAKWGSTLEEKGDYILHINVTIFEMDIIKVHYLPSDYGIEIHEHRWAQCRNTWGISVRGETMTLDYWLLGILISMPRLVRPGGWNVVSRRAGIFVCLDHSWDNTEMYIQWGRDELGCIWKRWAAGRELNI